MRGAILGGVVLVAAAIGGARAGGLPTIATAEACRIILGDIAAYQATGRPCACPYSFTRAGKPCGRLSAWAKPGGAAPRCYLDDVTDERVPDVRGGPARQTWPQPPPCRPAS